MTFKFIKAENNYLSIVVLIYACFNIMCVFAILLNLLLSIFFTFDEIPFKFMDIDLFLVIFIYLYFRFHYIICPLVILCFLIERIIVKMILKPQQSTFFIWFKKYQNVIFIISISIAISFNILLIHYSPDLLAGID